MRISLLGSSGVRESGTGDTEEDGESDMEAPSGRPAEALLAAECQPISLVDSQASWAGGGAVGLRHESQACASL